MATIRKYQRKIGSLKNTRKITGSMKMISSIKLQKISAVVEKSAEFRAAARDTEQLFAALPSEENLPALVGYPEVKGVDVVLITGDRGLCGRFNTNLISVFMHEHSKFTGRGSTVNPVCIGMRGAAFLSRRGMDVTVFEKIIGNPDWNNVRPVGKMLFDRFTAGTVQETWVVYARRVSSMSEEPCLRRLLPFDTPAQEDAPPSSETEYLQEYSGVAFGKAAELLTCAGVFDAIVSSAYAEHAARMSAMDSASSNCDRLTDKYTQLRNRARQAVITTELNEIVTGKEALES